MKRFFYLAPLAFVACATPPTYHDVRNSAEVARPYDAAWTDIVGYFASRNIQIQNIAKDSGVIYAQRAGFDNDAADCGNPGILIVVGRRATLNVFVRKLDTGNTSITVNTTFIERRRFENNIMDTTCSSRGTAEDHILNAARGLPS